MTSVQAPAGGCEGDHICAFVPALGSLPAISVSCGGVTAGFTRRCPWACLSLRPNFPFLYGNGQIGVGSRPIPEYVGNPVSSLIYA